MYRLSVILARTLLALPFLIFGLNTVLWSAFGQAFFEPPEDLPVKAQAFLDGLTSTGFAHTVRGIVEFLAGLLILTGALAPLGLVLLAPILVHVVLYHQYLDPDPGGRIFSYVLLFLALYVAWAYRAAYRGLFTAARLQRPSQDDGR